MPFPPSPFSLPHTLTLTVDGVEQTRTGNWSEVVEYAYDMKKKAKQTLTIHIVRDGAVVRHEELSKRYVRSKKLWVLFLGVWHNCEGTPYNMYQSASNDLCAWKRLENIDGSGRGSCAYDAGFTMRATVSATK